MKSIETYQIIKSTNHNLLSEAVNIAINDGWQPWGAPFMADGWIYQALVWYDESTS